MSIKALLRKLFNPKVQKPIIEEADALMYYLLADQLAGRALAKDEILQLIAILLSNIGQEFLEGDLDALMALEGGPEFVAQLREELAPYFILFNFEEDGDFSDLASTNTEKSAKSSNRAQLSQQARDYLNRFIRRLDVRLGGTDRGSSSQS